jgi:hypothetical protein
VGRENGSKLNRSKFNYFEFEMVGVVRYSIILNLKFAVGVLPQVGF